jgi:hypothetical protein
MMKQTGHQQEHSEGLNRDAFCLNCKTPVVGMKFCPECGQENFNYRTRLGRLIAFWWDRNVSIDGKLVRTLWTLLSRPGELTVAYFDGQRARYTPPGQLYFLLGLIYFFLLTSSIRTQVTYGNGKPSASEAAQADSLQESARPTNQDSSSFRGLVIGPVEKDRPMIQADLTDENVPDSLRSLSRDSLLSRIVGSGGWSGADKDLRNAFISVESIFAIKRVLNEQIEALTLLSVPLFALALLIFYRRSHRYFIDHLIMALHFYSVGFLLAVPVFLLSSGDENAAPILAMTLVLIIYFGLSVRRVYRPRWWATLVHCLVLSLYSFVLFALLVVLVWFGNIAFDIGVLKYAPSWWSLIN